MEPATAELLRLAEQAQPHLTGAEQTSWLGRLEEARPRFNEMLQGCRDGGDHATGLRLCALLGRYWWMCGHAAEGRRWLLLFLAHPVADAELRARALEALASIDYARADYVAAERWLDEAITFWKGRGDDLAEARLTNQLGMVRRHQGHLDDAWKRHEEALALYRARGDVWGEAACLNNLGVVAMFRGDLSTAKGSHEQALGLRRRLGDDRGVASSLGNLGNVARLAGDLDTAARSHGESLKIRTRLGDRWGVAGSLLNLGAVAALRGDFAEARHLLDEAEAGFRAGDDALGQCEVLDARALLAAMEGSDEAARLFEEAEQHRARIGAPLPPAFRAEVEKAMRRAGQ